MLLPAEKAYALLREKTIEAVKNIPNAKPLVHNKPITLRAEMVERFVMPKPYEKPYMKVIDGRTYEVTADSMEQALFRL